MESTSSQPHFNIVAESLDNFDVNAGYSLKIHEEDRNVTGDLTQSVTEQVDQVVQDENSFDHSISTDSTLPLNGN